MGRTQSKALLNGISHFTDVMGKSSSLGTIFIPISLIASPLLSLLEGHYCRYFTGVTFPLFATKPIRGGNELLPQPLYNLLPSDYFSCWHFFNRPPKKISRFIPADNSVGRDSAMMDGIKISTGVAPS